MRSIERSSAPMRSLLRAGFASLALHAVALLAALFGRGFHFPVPPIPVEIRTAPRAVAQAAEPARGVPQPPAPPRAKPPGGSGVRRKPGHGPSKKPIPIPSPALPPLVPLPPPAPPATADLRALSPGDARLMLLVRTDRIRNTPHRAAVELLLQAFPDYGTLFADTGISPLADLDALLIATPNIFDVTATFFAARHAADGRVRAALAGRTLPSWDPRTFRFPEPTLSILARPNAPAPVAAPVPGLPPLPAPASPLAASPTDGAAPAPFASTSASTSTSTSAATTTAISGAAAKEVAAHLLEARWLDGLRNFERVSNEPGAPALLVTAEDLDALLRVQDRFPAPASAALAVTADPSPAIRATLLFTDPAEAARFAVEWPAVLRRWHEGTDFIGLGPLFDDLALHHDHQTVELVGHLPESTVRTALMLARMFLSRNRISSVVLPPAPESEPAQPSSSAPHDLGAPPPDLHAISATKPPLVPASDLGVTRDGVP